MRTEVKTAIVIPSYNEILALPELLLHLKTGLTREDAIIVMDDSPVGTSTLIEEKCSEALVDSELKFIFKKSGVKSGRGAAIRNGMEIALVEFPNIERLIECDADGSHQPSDILKIKNSPSTPDLLIGSRYLTASEIVGWPISRRVFSWLLNKSIPRLTGVRVCDITNGLRSYSKLAVVQILSKPQLNSGFIYLSEQAIIISHAGMEISEEPIIFLDRTLGKSTVTWREISNSIYGIFGLVISSHKKL